jgi:hypothetical protein
MHRKALGICAIVAALLFGSAQSSQASVIDFTNRAAWGGANGLTSFARLVDGVLVTVGSQNGRLTFNGGGDVNSLCFLTGLSCQGDGLGVGDDEVTRGSSLLDTTLERLFVSFSAPVNISKLGFLDLFAKNIFTGDQYAETAMWGVQYAGGGVSPIQSTTGIDFITTLGYRGVATNYANVIGLQFFAVPPASTNSDFSVAKIEFTRTVPEPATLLLSGLGMAFVSLRRRVRRAA